MADPAVHRNFLLASMALRSLSIGSNEIIIGVFLLEEKLPHKIDAITVSTGLARSTVANILKRWTVTGIVSHLPGEGYQLRLEQSERLSQLLTELEQICTDQIHYFSKQTLDWVLEDGEANRFKLDPSVAQALRTRKLSNG